MNPIGPAYGGSLPPLNSSINPADNSVESVIRDHFFPLLVQAIEEAAFSVGLTFPNIEVRSKAVRDAANILYTATSGLLNRRITQNIIQQFTKQQELENKT